MTFYSSAALLHLSGSHVYADTMTVQVACSAGCPGGTSSPCRGTITPAQRNEQGCSPGACLPGCPAPLLRHPPPYPTPPPLCSPRSGHKVLSYSHQTVWLEAAADVTVFVFGFVSILRLFSLPCILSAVAARALGVWVFKKLKKRGLWKRSWGLGSWTSWIAFFCFFFSFSLPLQPKVQSKQCEVNGFIFSCARQFVHNRGPLLFVLFTINANIY